MHAAIVAMTETEVDSQGLREFHDWYNLRHMPDHVACPGFIRGSRYQAVEDESRFLAVYWIADESALSTPEVSAAGAEGWGAIERHIRGVSSRTLRGISHSSRAHNESRSAEYLIVNWFDRRPSWTDADFELWFAESHAPRIYQSHTVRSIFLCESADAGPKQVCLYEADSPAAAMDVSMAARVSDLRTLRQQTFRRILTIENTAFESLS